ncbi:MAG: DUF5060 domain-containing protein [Bacteroidales bacterium]|nr:DUF5060 domain-containing protein [Bacteroidales bacterium]
MIANYPLLIAWAFAASSVVAQPVKQWGTFEKTLISNNAYTNAEKYKLQLTATFTAPDSTQLVVPGFGVRQYLENKILAITARQLELYYSFCRRST